MRFIILITTILFALNSISQDNDQIFRNVGFKVKCPCLLRVNSTFIKLVKEQGKSVIGAYLCAENEDDPEHGVINNINIYDESSSYAKLSPRDFAYFEKKYLDEYANQLLINGMQYKYVVYKGVSALEYSFDQMGLPTKAIMFLKNKRSYLIQVASRFNLEVKFNSLKNSFEFF